MSKVLEVKNVNLGKQASHCYADLRGIIYLNDDKFPLLDENERIFAILHEAGHINLFTNDENLADNYAFVEYVKLGLPTSSIMSCLKKSLSNKDLSIQRLRWMEQRIAKFEELKNIQSLNGTGDWLNIISQLFGVGAQVAGGTSTEQQLAIEEANRIKQDEENKKTVSYLLAGVAIVAIIIIIFITQKK